MVFVMTVQYSDSTRSLCKLYSDFGDKTKRCLRVSYATFTLTIDSDFRNKKMRRRYMIIIPAGTNEPMSLAKYTKLSQHAKALGADDTHTFAALSPQEKFERVFVVDDIGVLKNLPNNTRAQEILVRMGIYERETVPTIAGTMLFADVGSATEVRAFWRKFTSFVTE